MNYFECAAASHGGGSSNTITVTCDSGFAGVTLTCTDGNDTYTKVCPSVSPYTVDFENLAAGDWTISGTVQGTSYSKVVSISDSYATTLESVFSWATWVDLSQNYHSADYNNLAEVFADEGALYELMTIHACCDYLIDAVSDNVDVIDDFCANDTAMKWIGLRDYVCDGLTAINGVEAKFLASQYWERYLKDHVPTMTSNTAPYGEASDTSVNVENDYWKAFDKNPSTSWISVAATNSRIIYKFTNPICVKKVSITPIAYGGYSRLKAFKVQGSNDGTTWNDLYEGEITSPTDTITFEIANNSYYLYYSVLGTTANQTNVGIGLAELQFYGRSLNVSVPVMTSNTAPFGEASASSANANYEPWRAFNPSESNGWITVSGEGWLNYHFDTPIHIKQVVMKQQLLGGRRCKNFSVEASKDNYNTSDILITDVLPDDDLYHVFNVTPDDYSDIRLNVSSLWSGGSSFGIGKLQFYGLDYSEREFEPNTNKKWLYDHGLELETLTTSGAVTKGSDYLTLSAVNSEATANIDLTDYSILRCKVGDHMSGTTQLSVGGSNPAAATLTSANAPNNNSLGISSFSQSLATGVKMTANGICDITELWVE